MTDPIPTGSTPSGSAKGRLVRDLGVYTAARLGLIAVVAAVLDAAPAWLEEHGEIAGRGRVRIIVAGAPPPTKTVARVEVELGWEFIQIYGLTETSPLLTMSRK